MPKFSFKKRAPHEDSSKANRSDPNRIFRTDTVDNSHPESSDHPSAGSSGGKTAKIPVISSSPPAGSIPQQALAGSASSKDSAPLSSSPARAIVNKALTELSKEEREVVEKYADEGGDDPKVALDSAYNAAKKRQDEYENQQGAFTVGKRKIKFKSITNNIVKFLNKFKGVGDILAGLDPAHAGIPWAGVKVLLELSLAHQRVMGELLSGIEISLYIGNRLKVYYDFLDTVPPDQARTNVEDQLVKLQVKLLKFIASAIILYQKNSFLRTWSTIWGVDGVDEFDAECHKIATQVEIDAALCSRKNSAEMMTKLKDLDEIKSDVIEILTSIQLSELAFAGDARFDSDTQDDQAKCLRSTRVDLLREITDWANSPEGPCIFWLHGEPGTGKSTISRTVAQLFHDTGQLGASFFFQRDSSDCGSSKKFFTTIARQLVDSFPVITPFIVEEIKNDASIKDQNLKYQFEHLIKRPLSEGIEDGTTVVLVIDALDECKNELKSNRILPLLARACEIKGTRLRVFLTSRPWTVIEQTFRDNKNLKDGKHINVSLEEVPATGEDLLTFFTNELGKIRPKSIKGGQPWPGNTVLAELVAKAEPSFIFAATICRSIADPRKSSEKQLELVRKSPFASQGSKLDDTYMPIMTQLSIDDDQELQQEYCKLLETIALISEPLSIRALALLLRRKVDEDDKNEEAEDEGDEESMESIRRLLPDLCSVIRIPTEDDSPVRVFHLSFREFLLDPKKGNKAVEAWWWVDEYKGHENIAWRCLVLMSSTLKRNACNFKSPGEPSLNLNLEDLAENIHTAVQYACRYWVHHFLIRKTKRRPQDAELVLGFLHKHFLHWIEALAWMGRISEGFNMVNALSSHFTNHEDTKISEFLHDANRFLLRNRYIIQLAPLQIYSSALIFAPQKSHVRKTFEKEIRGMSILPQMPLSWSGELQKLQGPKGSIRAAAYSPDGQNFASSSWGVGPYPAIQLWNPLIGEQTHELNGHEDEVDGIDFNPVTATGGMASCSKDGSVRLWDLSTDQEYKVLRHKEPICSVAFFPDGRLAFAKPYSVHVWNEVTDEVTQTDINFQSRVDIMKISPNPNTPVLAVGSCEGQIVFWDYLNQKLNKTDLGPMEYLNDLAFSANGLLLASASSRFKVQLWNSADGKWSRDIKFEEIPGSSGVEHVIFIPIKGWLAASALREISLWDTETGHKMMSLNVDSVSTFMVPSPDGRILSLGHRDGYSTLWDIASIQTYRETEARGGVQECVASVDGGRFAWAYPEPKSKRYEIVVYNPETGDNVHIEPNGGFRYPTIELSRDGRWLVYRSHHDISAPNSSNISIIDLLGETERWEFSKGHSVGTISISSDSRLLGFGHEDGAVSIWDLASGRRVPETCTFRNNLGGIRSLAFSNDGQLLAVGAYGQHLGVATYTIDIWDFMVEDQDKKPQTIQCNSSPRSMAFSNDNQLLAAVYYEHLTLHDLMSPDAPPLGTIDFDELRINRISFSKDNNSLYTDRGILEIPSGDDDDSLTPNSNPPAIYLEDEWITIDGENYLWIPHDYRPGTDSFGYYAFANNRLAIVTISGRPIFFGFDVKSMVHSQNG